VLPVLRVAIHKPECAVHQIARMFVVLSVSAMLVHLVALILPQHAVQMVCVVRGQLLMHVDFQMDLHVLLIANAAQTIVLVVSVP
jgi:hypothetical protein